MTKHTANRFTHITAVGTESFQFALTRFLCVQHTLQSIMHSFYLQKA
jgi:hypothetical protein